MSLTRAIESLGVYHATDYLVIATRHNAAVSTSGTPDNANSNRLGSKAVDPDLSTLVRDGFRLQPIRLLCRSSRGAGCESGPRALRRFAGSVLRHEPIR